MAMFIAGFWYGGKLVREDKISAATVMTVFWACLLGSASLQQLVPHLVHINHGKESMASLVGLMEAPSVVKPKARPESRHSTDTFLSLSSVTSTKLKNSRRPWSRSKPAAKTTQLAIRQIKPNNAKGEYNLENVTFAYPSRPENLVLDDVSLFLPAGETTFIVGGSGSGKSTVAQLLLRLYQPDRGEVTLDDQDIQYLDLDFNREHVAAVQQGCIMFDMSVHDNVAMGLAGLSKRKPEDATREEVIEACRMAMMHDFISDLPQQYETKLGTKGASLSGGQKQRLAIARARLRDPTVLILGKQNSCDTAIAI
jgi:ATP-binding cassette subfamily B (MDR/TAP) protein 1